MEPHFRINVSRNGVHFFATATHSCVSKRQAQEVYKELSNRFPVGEGFKVDVSFVDCVGYSVNPNDWKTIYDEEDDTNEWSVNDTPSQR